MQAPADIYTSTKISIVSVVHRVAFRRSKLLRAVRLDRRTKLNYPDLLVFLEKELLFTVL